MTEEVKRKKRAQKYKCVVKRPYRYLNENSPMRKKGEASLTQEEYEYASSMGFLEIGV